MSAVLLLSVQRNRNKVDFSNLIRRRQKRLSIDKVKLQTMTNTMEIIEER